MGKEQGCLLWDRTRDLANERGFEMSVKCPMVDVCDGSRCIYLAAPEPEKKEIKRFYARLEKHNVRKRK